MAKLIKADGTEQEVGPATGTKFTLAEMQKLVGGYVQVIKVNGNERIVVDEVGSMRGRPVNKAASELLQSYSRTRTIDLVGDVLFGGRKEFGLG